MNNNLKSIAQKNWDACILGDGVSAILLSKYLSSKGLSVLWIVESDELTHEKATLQSAWLWNVSNVADTRIAETLFKEFGYALDPERFELSYYDAKSSKRMRSLEEAHIEWGEHEAAFFEKLNLKETVNIHPFTRIIQQREFEGAQDFVKLTEMPVIEIKAVDGKIGSVVIAKKASQEFEVKAAHFFICEAEEFVSVIRDESSRAQFAAVVRGKSFYPGFGLKFQHKNFENAPEQSIVCPMVVNPAKKQDISHLAGFFEQSESGLLTSYWFGFLNSDEVEDNNEILKKIKHSKRAIDRALPGFSDSIVNENVSFDMKMFCTVKKTVKKSKNLTEALGVALLTDKMGAETAMANLLSAIKPFNERAFLGLKRESAAPVEDLELEQENVVI